MFTADIKSKSTILGLLYHASMDDKVKAMFTNTDCIPMVYMHYLGNFYTYKFREIKESFPIILYIMCIYHLFR